MIAGLPGRWKNVRGMRLEEAKNASIEPACEIKKYFETILSRGASLF